MTSSSSSPAADSTPAPESPQAPLATASEPRASGSNKVDYDPTDNFTTRWRNIFAILSGRMSDEGREKYRIAKDDRNEEADCKRCEDSRDFLLTNSSMIVFLRQSLNKLGGDLNSTNIRCRRCHVRQAGGFDPNYGILICANEMINRSHIEDTLAHEMMHAYDHLRFKMDWKNNLRHAACTEIRASSLSGECRWTREFFSRTRWKIAEQHQECVRRRAALSLRARPGVKDDVQAAKLVNEVWDSCFADTRPFDEIFR